MKLVNCRRAPSVAGYKSGHAAGKKTRRNGKVCRHQLGALAWNRTWTSEEGSGNEGKQEGLSLGEPTRSSIASSNDAEEFWLGLYVRTQFPSWEEYGTCPTYLCWFLLQNPRILTPFFLFFEQTPSFRPSSQERFRREPRARAAQAVPVEVSRKISSTRSFRIRFCSCWC